MKYLILLLILSPFANAKIAEEELMWQTLHLVDIAQTVEGTKRLYKESDKLTKSIIGTHPSESDVYAWGAASSVAHYFLMNWLTRNTKYGKVIRKVDVAFKFSYVASNYNAGIRVSF